MLGGGASELARILERRLRSIALGAKAVLDSLALRRAQKSFTRLLVEDPRAAYEVLLEYTRGDRRQARYILAALLEALGAQHEELTAAILSLERGDPEPLRRLLRRYGG